MRGIPDHDRFSRMGQSMVRNRQQPALVEAVVGERDQRFRTAAIVPFEHGRRQAAGRLRQEAVARKIGQHVVVIDVGRVSVATEKIGRR